jgi:hypothetical protein
VTNPTSPECLAIKARILALKRAISPEYAPSVPRRASNRELAVALTALGFPVSHKCVWEWACGFKLPTPEHLMALTALEQQTKHNRVTAG